MSAAMAKGQQIASNRQKPMIANSSFMLSSYNPSAHRQPRPRLSAVLSAVAPLTKEDATAEVSLTKASRHPRSPSERFRPLNILIRFHQCLRDKKFRSLVAVLSVKITHFEQDSLCKRKQAVFVAFSLVFSALFASSAVQLVV